MPSSIGMYAKLVELYPKSYRQRYGQPMIQTFDDMLEAEQSKTGRLLIWARVLRDLPGSALKEHLTNGKGVAMSRNLKIVLVSVAAALLLANGMSYWFGILHARQAVGIERVSTTQLADAMKKDGFYSHYGNAALLFKGQVVAVKQQNNVTIATFKTHSTYLLECQFSNLKLVIGDVISVVAPGGSANRLGNGVLLHDCVRG